MVPIPISEFVSGPLVPVDLYIRLHSDKYVMVAKEATKTQLDQLRSYNDKAVSYLFVRRDHYGRYVGSHLAIAGIVLARSEIVVEGKADFLAKASTAVMREIETLGFSPESYDHARNVAAATTALVNAKLDIHSVLYSLGRTNDAVLAHSVAVSAVAVMIGKMMGWTKPATLEKLSLGGLLHDVGLKEIPIEITNRPRAQLSVDELLLLETHSFRGMEILRTVPSVPDDIIAIAYEHHENALGQGYPRKLRDLRMNPLAKVIALADQFVELTISSPNCPVPKSPMDAVQYIELVMGQPFNREAFAALRQMAMRATGQSAA